MGSKLSYGTRYLMWNVNWGSQPPSLLPLRFPHQPRLIGVPLFSFYLWCATVRIRVLREKVWLLAVRGVEWKARRIAGIWPAFLVAVLDVVIGLQCAEFPGCHWLNGDDPKVAMEYMDHGGTTPKPKPRRGHPRKSIAVNNKIVPGSSILR